MFGTFLYFAYGSNMNAERIHYKNPTAKLKCIGKLKDYCLDFHRFTKRWQGCVATVVPSPGSEVWGVIWEINESSLALLDEEEGVNDNIYLAKTVTVNTALGENLECRIYQQRQLPQQFYEPKLLVSERQPSPIYLNMIISGAEDHKIPKDYLKFLKSFPHNGFD